MNEGNIRLFIVGRSGNGMTSTITSLLSENNQVPSKSKLYKIFKDDVFVAVDGSGIGDGEGDMKQSDEEVEQSIASILKEIGEDFESLICVFKYGVRFTNQENVAVNKVKYYFGENIFKERGIIVLTYGDNFDLDCNQSFKEWCNVQTGTFKELLSTCNGRIVLFNNRTRDVHQANKQREQLKQAVENLRTTKPDRFSPIPALSHVQAVEDQRNIKPDIKSPIPALLHEQAVGMYNDGDQTSNSSTQQLLPESKPSSEADYLESQTRYEGHRDLESQTRYEGHRDLESQTRYEGHRDLESQTRYEGHRDVESQTRYEGHRDVESQTRYEGHRNLESQTRYEGHRDVESQTRYDGHRDPFQAMLVEIKTGNRRILWCFSFVIFVICVIGAVLCLKLFHVF